MPLPEQPGAYNECYEIWERALLAASSGGIRTLVGLEKDALYLRLRMNTARKLLRDQSRKAYPKDHPLWDTSVYDRLKISLKTDDDGDWWLYVEPWGDWKHVKNIEPIPEAERIALPPPPDTPEPVSIPDGPIQDDLD